MLECVEKLTTSRDWGRGPDPDPGRTCHDLPITSRDFDTNTTKQNTKDWIDFLLISNMFLTPQAGPERLLHQCIIYVL